jgi:hypothetical protein
MIGSSVISSRGLGRLWPRACTLTRCPVSRVLLFGALIGNLLLALLGLAPAGCLRARKA